MSEGLEERERFMKEIVITEKEAGQTFHKFLLRVLPAAGSGFLYKMLRKKNITLNGAKADGSERLQSGDSVKIFFSDDTLLKFMGTGRKDVSELKKLSGTVEVLYEDEAILILNKPSGILSQKSRADDISMNEEMIAYLIKSGFLSEEDLKIFRPSVCNRLDRNTSGILLCGKSIYGMNLIGNALRERTVHKYYRCLVFGHIKEPCRISGYLTKDERSNRVSVTSQETPDSLRIETEYTPLRSFFLKNNPEREIPVSYLEVLLLTGRSHQIRAHLSSIGHPLLGDFKYGKKDLNLMLKREYGITDQMLHAYRIEGAGLPTVTAPVPENFLTLLEG